jgi:hypothetical protein
MTVQLNGELREFPSSLADITIGQRIAFHEQYGQAFEKQLQEIIAMPEGWQKTLSFSLYQDSLSAAFVGFFLGVDDVRGLPADAVLSIYSVVYSALQEQEESLQPATSFVWNDREWVLAAPVLSAGSSIQFGELIDAKQIIKDIAEDKGTRWHLLHRVACIFLRQPTEQYEQAYSEPGSVRFELMKGLPLDIAFQVGFFLTSWISSFKTTSLFSNQDEEAEAATYQSILTAGVGSIFSNQSLKQKSSIGPGAGSTAFKRPGWLKPSMFWFSLRRKRTTAKL